MKVFLLTESQEYPHGDGMLVVALNEERARELAAKTSPRSFASDGQILWRSKQTTCIEFGECPPDLPERTVMKGHVLFWRP